MKKISKLLLIFTLVLSLLVLASCGDGKKKDNNKDSDINDPSHWDDTNYGGGVEGPVVDA